jgi:glycosyltransferase involved in cell wall biosynthesis
VSRYQELFESMDPLVSIIVPTYNSAVYLKETIESILSQSYKDFELIVVDDGSDDDTRKVLEPFIDDIRYYYQENSGGPAKPRNVGIEHAKGKYISFFDSDDLMLPKKLEYAVKFMEAHPSIVLSFTNFFVCSENGELYDGTQLDKYNYFMNIPRTEVQKDCFILSGDDVFEGLFFENFIGTSSVLASKELFSTVGIFDERITHGGLDDRDMWLRVTSSYDIAYIDIVGHIYRNHSQGISKRVIASNLCRIEVIKKYLNKIKSKTTLKQARTLIANCYYGIGFQYQAKTELDTARKYFLKGLSHKLHFRCFRGLVITFLGRKIYNFLRQQRNF